jgi:hypothetical protein
MEILLTIMRQFRYSTLKIASYISPYCSSVALTLRKEILFSEFCIHLNCMCVLAWNSMNGIMSLSASVQKPYKNACQRLYN